MKRVFMTPYVKRILFLSILLIALGVTLANTLNENSKPLGLVLLAVGGLIFMVGMRRKQQQSNQDEP
ncbi:DUF202 domain-containing protein [Parvicella tangerina]|nr:DUF202 domain-containing protein [Parvicella tangerina]